MTFLATTRVAVLRGTSESPLGDEVDSNDPVVNAVAGLASIPASLIERSKAVYDPASGQRRTVRVVTCRLPVAVAHPETGVRVPVALEADDRIVDLTTGRIYAFDDSTHVPRSLAGQASLTLDLRDTAALSPAPA